MVWYSLSIMASPEQLDTILRNFTREHSFSNNPVFYFIQSAINQPEKKCSLLLQSIETNNESKTLTELFTLLFPDVTQNINREEIKKLIERNPEIVSIVEEDGQTTVKINSTFKEITMDLSFSPLDKNPRQIQINYEPNEQQST